MAICASPAAERSGSGERRYFSHAWAAYLALMALFWDSACRTRKSDSVGKRADFVAGSMIKRTV